MLRYAVLIALTGFCVAPSSAPAWPSPHSVGVYAYVSPAPGSGYHNPETNVIVRPGGVIDPASLTGKTLQVTGSLSGAHPGVLRVSDDKETLLFRPDQRFQPGEEVVCVIAPGLRTEGMASLPGAQFDFYVDPSTALPVLPLASIAEELEEARTPRPMVPSAGAGRVQLRTSGLAADSVPADLPPLSTSVTGSPAEGLLFLCDVRFDDANYRSHLMVLNDDGAPRFVKTLAGSGYDFKVQPNGNVTYFDAATLRHYAWNANFALRDSFQCGNGYTTDLHELQLLPNGHALVLAYDTRRVDLSGIVAGGSTQASVIGLVIQELDRSHDVVFQWRSWDHFRITDCVSRPLTGARVDYVHGNSIEPDRDGNLLVSCRHLDEITKIDRGTGAILWRLGGSNNEFTFPNDPGHFSQQHSARRLPNGHLLLFDNGNYHDPARSRAVEYAVDEVKRTATRIWEYRNAPDAYGSAMGSVQRLANGDTVIGWGNTNPTVTEVTSAGVEVFEGTLPAAVYSYRAFRHEWPPVLEARLALDHNRVEVSGGSVVVEVGGDAFDADSILPATVRLQGVSPDAFTPPATPGGPAICRFPADLLLASLPPGVRQLELEAALAGGERIRGVAAVMIDGTRRIRARMVSAVGAQPIQIAFRSDGVRTRRVRLAAFDVRGRRVASWTDDLTASGLLAWNGRRSDGRLLASGVYYIRTEGTALVETAKVILVR